VSARGAYGLRIGGVDAPRLLTEVDPRLPSLELTLDTALADDRRETFGEDRAEIELIDGGWVSLDRSGHAHFVLPFPVPPEEVVHPWMVPAAATFNGWLGRQVLHGGAVAADGRAVAILGDKGAGKSSLLAELAVRGDIEILADDLVVMEDGHVFPGPRCIDLRPESSQARAARPDQRLVRDGTRLRLELEPSAAVSRLTAIVVLGWTDDDDVRLTALRASDGLAAVLPHTLGWLGIGPAGRLLDLLGVPVWLLTRARDWSTMPEAGDRLCDLLGQAGPRKSEPTSFVN
jgi:hypothetical protein